SSRCRVHANFRIDENVKRIAENRFAPARNRQRTLDEALTELARRPRYLVLLRSRIIPENAESAAIELGEPAPDGDLPIGGLPEKSADDAHPHGLFFSMRRRQGRGSGCARHDPAHEVAIKSLELSIIYSLVGQVEGLMGSDRIRQAGEGPCIFDVLVELPQVLLVSGALSRYFRLMDVKNW